MRNLSASKADAYLPYLNAAMDEFEINSRLRVAAFLSQLAAESGEFKWFNELASGAEYEGRKDLGNTKPGDGRRYKGRGPIQLTGRNNYRAAGKALGLDLEGSPELASSPEVAFRTAGWFWDTNHINRFADKDNIRAVTLLVNAGRSTGAMPERAHFPVRQEYYERAKKVLESVDFDGEIHDVQQSMNEVIKPEPETSPEAEKPLVSGVGEKKEDVSGTPPPAPAAEVKASQASWVSKIGSLSLPAGVTAVLATVGKFFMTLPPWGVVAIIAIAVVVAYLIWRDAHQRAHERTLMVMGAAADKTKNNLRLV